MSSTKELVIFFILLHWVASIGGASCHHDPDEDMEHDDAMNDLISQFKTLEFYGTGTRRMARYLKDHPITAPPADWTVNRNKFVRHALPLEEVWVEDVLEPVYNFPATIDQLEQDLEEAMYQNKDSDEIAHRRLYLVRELLLDGQTEEAITVLHEMCFENALHNTTTCLSSRANTHWDLVLRKLLIVAYIRLAEQENCRVYHNHQSCLFPLKGSAIHKKRRGSSTAIKLLLNEMKRKTSTDRELLENMWLLNLAYMTLGLYPHGVPSSYLIPESAFKSEVEDFPTFPNVATGLNIDSWGALGGCAVDDFDNDGFLDIFVSSQGMDDELYYFHNSNGTFVEIHKLVGLKGLTGGVNLNQVDYNNDGYLDVFIMRGGWFGDALKHPNSLLRNNGDGTFEDVTEDAGLISYFATHSSSWADYDLDGHVDLFVATENSRCGELYHNNGDGTFTDVAEICGLCGLGMIKGASWGDFNNDGYPDLYLSEIMDSNKLFVNQGRHHPDDPEHWLFKEVGEAAGVSKPQYGFPVAWLDVNNDGWLDLLAASFGHEGPAEIASLYTGIDIGVNVRENTPHIYMNNKDGTFRDAVEMKVDRVLNAMGMNIGDLDNDGFLDLYFGTGTPDFRALQPNIMLKNHEGKYFEDVTFVGGFGHLQKGHGICFADIDHDGDQDIFAELGAVFTGDGFHAAFFLNPGFPENSWVTIKLEGVKSNRAAIGTKVKIVTIGKDSRTQEFYHEISTGASYGSNSLQLEAGLGKATKIDHIQVTWPASRTVQVFREVPMRKIIKIVEGNDKFEILERRTVAYDAASLIS